MFDSPNGVVANHANLRGALAPALEDVAGSAWHGIDLLTRHSSHGLGSLVPDLPGSCSCPHAVHPRVAELQPAVGGWRSPQAAPVLPGTRDERSSGPCLCRSILLSTCFRSHNSLDECVSLDAASLSHAHMRFLSRSRIDCGVAAACCQLLSVSFWNLSCRPIVRVLRSVQPDVQVRLWEKGQSATSCSPSSSSVPRTTTSGPDSLRRLAVRAVRPAANRLRRLPPPTKARGVDGPSRANPASALRHPSRRPLPSHPGLCERLLGENRLRDPHRPTTRIAAPVRTQIAANGTQNGPVTRETAANPPARIATTEAVVHAAAVGVVVVRARAAPASAPAVPAPLPHGLPPSPGLPHRDAIGGGVHAVPRTVVLRIAVDNPIAASRLAVATAVPPSKHNLNPNPKAVAVAANVAASAVLPGIGSPDTCKTPRSPPAKSSASWNR